MPKRPKGRDREKLRSVEEQLGNVRILPASEMAKLLNEKLGIPIEASREVLFGEEEIKFHRTFRVRADPMQELAGVWTANNLPAEDIARILEIASEAFDDADRARRWLEEPNIQAGNKPPVSLIGTPEGFAAVESVLRQIQYGVFG